MMSFHKTRIYSLSEETSGKSSAVIQNEIEGSTKILYKPMIELCTESGIKAYYYMF